MSQTIELLEPDYCYHIYNHANGSDNLFKTDDNYYYFLEKYIQHISPIADTFAYCLLPNHFHFFIRINSLDKLVPLQGFKTLEGVSIETTIDFVSQQFSNLFNGYTQAYNKKFNRKGSLFIPRFKRKRVQTPDYFIQLIKYIHLNPVHHGFVTHPSDWKFSSYNSFIYTKPTKIKRDEALQWFGDINNFTLEHQSPLNEKFILDLEL